MTVQARYPSNFLPINNRGGEDMDFPPAPSGLMDQSGGIFFSNGMANGNGRKRLRESAPPGGLFSRSAAATPTFVNLAQLQNQPAPPVVSTGLRLSTEAAQNQSLLSQSFSVVPVEIMAQQREEIDQVLAVQGEQLRRILTARWQQHYRTMVQAADEAAAWRLREKTAEAEQAARRTVELEDRLSRLRAEAMAWQAKAMTDQATAASLHAQLQLATAEAAGPPRGEESGESPDVDDAESATVGPDRVERTCRACRFRQAEVVVLPCRHLCFCTTCDAAVAAAGDGCGVCGCRRTGSVQVFLS